MIDGMEHLKLESWSSDTFGYDKVSGIPMGVGGWDSVDDKTICEEET